MAKLDRLALIVLTTQLFFLGSTLIFIGFDLLYEWIVEVRHKVCCELRQRSLVNNLRLTVAIM